MTRAIAGLLLLLGGAIVVSTIARGGGPLSLGILFGVAIALLGAGRLYLSLRAEGSPRADA